MIGMQGQVRTRSLMPAPVLASAECPTAELALVLLLRCGRGRGFSRGRRRQRGVGGGYSCYTSTGHLEDGLSRVCRTVLVDDRWRQQL